MVTLRNSTSLFVVTTAAALVAGGSLSAVAAEPSTPVSGFRRWISERMANLPTAGLAPTSQPPYADAVAEADADDAEVEATADDPVTVTADEQPAINLDAASFRGIRPGTSTLAEVEAAWGPGEPVAREDGSTGLSWKVEPFERVEIQLEDDVIVCISIKLAQPAALGDLARQLQIADLRTVSLVDDGKRTIGAVYPERGVIISVTPGTESATGIMIEPLDADLFVLRAEEQLETCSAYACADLECAVQIDPGHVRAHRLLLSLASDRGRWEQALDLAETIGRLDPKDVWVRLKHAGVLLALDRPDEAAAVLDTVKDLDASTPLVAAQCERLAGRIALARPKPDHQAAVEHFGKAIAKAATLATAESPVIQAAACEVSLDAHLGTALAIARGAWQQKSRVVPKWITKAESLVAGFPGPQRDKQALELQLCRGALAAAAGSAEAIEPLSWVKRMLELRDTMGDEVVDPWRRRQIDWAVGRGLTDAIAAAEARGDTSDMLDNATLTVAYLDRGAEHRELTDLERKEIGELHFRIGIMYSLQQGDHATAATWFDRVLPLWEDNDRFARDGELGRLGESYVSMAISYWQVNRRDDALRLSRRGVDLMVVAVDQRQLEERALAVAYGNLSTMYAEQGDEAQSKNYAEMASRAESTGATTVR